MLPIRLAIHFSHFVFSRNTPRNTKHSLYTFHISCEFRVLLMPRKNKPRNPLTFRVNAGTGAKCEKPKKGTRNAKYPTIHFSFFAFRTNFRVFSDKCIAGLTEKHFRALHIFHKIQDMYNYDRKIWITSDFNIYLLLYAH